jgi:hypothetical protein
MFWARTRGYGAVVSFDLYFVAVSPGETFQDAMDRLEQLAAEESELGAADVERWQTVLDQVRPLLPDAEEFAGESHRELSDVATGMQLSFAPGELSLTIPYWYTGPEAQAIVDRLRSVVLAVEAATGLTAYDPQADAPFVHAGHQTAAAAFDQVDASLRGGAARAVSAEGAAQPKRLRGLFRRGR